jgi:alpha-tubulin suppressor-like RCC1 family protein
MTKPTKIECIEDKKIVKISCGEAHSIALTSDGQVYGWGFTSNGQLGFGFCADSFEPGTGQIHSRILTAKQIIFENHKITDIECGKTFSTFLTSNSEVLVCGVNDLNQLGIDMPRQTKHLYKQNDRFNDRCMDVVNPTPIECFLNMKVTRIACGESHCLAVVQDLSNKLTTLWSWGSNKFGQLGQGSMIFKTVPRPISYLLGYTKSQILEVNFFNF